jgi:hypothetical protein
MMSASSVRDPSEKTSRKAMGRSAVVDLRKKASSRRNIMNQINDKQAYDLLRREGFTASEINRLLQLRRDYTASKQKQAPHAHPLLRFARWCVRVILTMVSAYRGRYYKLPIIGDYAEKLMNQITI